MNKSIVVDGIKYVEETKDNEMQYVIIRTYSAGVHSGYLKSRDGKEVELVQSRRFWYWEGACSLSQIAQEGVKKPENCKFSCIVDKIILTEAIEIIDVTEEAQKNIYSVPFWKS